MEIAKYKEEDLAVLDEPTHEEETGEDYELWEPGDDEAPFWEDQ